jgi:hypothetical protein
MYGPDDPGSGLGSEPRALEGSAGSPAADVLVDLGHDDQPETLVAQAVPVPASDL